MLLYCRHGQFALSSSLVTRSLGPEGASSLIGANATNAGHFVSIVSLLTDLLCCDDALPFDSMSVSAPLLSALKHFLMV